MKITAANFKPGMVVCRQYGEIKDYMLITAVQKTDTGIACTHFNYSDGYTGRAISYHTREEEFKHVTNPNKCKKIIKKILEDAFKLLHDAEENIDLIKLILSTKNLE